MEKDLVRLIAFYLPQFYPTVENDEWWGKGFTEWTMVAQGRPLYKGHHQPHLPSELGFYDLRYPEIREKQAQLAKEHGVHGFCYYHYWTKGRMLLERPFREVLNSGKPALPFCLCWGNHNWTRRWDGLENELLVKQEYSPEDDLEHINYLIPIFKDERYIKVEGKPLFAVHLAQWLPDPGRTARTWKEAVKKAGFPDLFLVNVENNYQQGSYRLEKGFDATIEFAPDARSLAGKLFHPRHNDPDFAGEPANLGFIQNGVYLYDSLARNMLAKPAAPYPRFRCVCPGWDNSPRRLKINRATILANNSPEKYQEFLERSIIDTYRTFQGGKRLLFINSWNEWSEGCHLEPDQRDGLAYLEATRAALRNTAQYREQEKARSTFDQYKYAHLIETEKGYENKYLAETRYGLGETETLYYARLFVDTGHDFNGDEKIEHCYSLDGSGRVKLNFDLKKFSAIKKLRIEPVTNYYSIITNVNIRIFDHDGKKVDIARYDTNATYDNYRKTFLFYTVGPQIVFCLPKGVIARSVEIEWEYVAIGDKAFRSIREMQNSLKMLVAAKLVKIIGKFKKMLRMFFSINSYKSGIKTHVI